MTTDSFRAAYPEPEREGVAPFVDEWGADLMILKRIYAERAAGHSLRAACGEVGWSLLQFARARIRYRMRDILAAPRTPRTAGADDPEIGRFTPFHAHMCHPDRTDYAPYPVTLDRLEALFAFNERRRMLFDGLRRYIEELRSRGQEGYLWIGGSYISEKEDPSDIDLLLLVSGGPPLPWKTRVICFNGPIGRPYAKEKMKCDPFAIDCRSDIAHLPRAIAYWIHHFAMPARAGDPLKGFFEVEL